MKTYHILKDFLGNQTGIGEAVQFVAGTTAELSDSLAQIALGEGWVKLASGANARETKVIGPEETKPAKPLNKMSKAELVAHALTKHGLELTPDDMSVKAMIEAIEAKQAETAA